MKDVLIITNYFPPEMGAASNRIYQLADGLKPDFNISVLCPLPNYPKGEIFDGYRRKFKVTESINGITTHRLWIKPSISKNKFVRLFSMLSYSFSLFWYIIWNKIPKTVIIQSPPLLVAFTSLLFLNSKKHKLILNVSDLWPSAGLDLGALKRGFGYNMLKRIERYNYGKASLILGQSEEILAHVKTITNQKRTMLYRNYPNFDKTDILPNFEDDSEKIKIVYAGLLGVAQGILNVCKNLEFTNYEFHIYGSGAEEKAIIDYIESHPNLPITFHGSLVRNELHEQLLKYDITLIPLLKRIYGSVPSKIFEYARLGLPMVYFAGGEGETIIEKYDLGWVVEAGNYNELNITLSKLYKNNFNSEMKNRIKDTSQAHFDFNKQLNPLKKEI